MNIHIIILTYNCLNKIKQCIGSLYKNTSHDFKLFIIENGSKDGTKEYVQSIKKNNLFFLIQEKNIGIIKGRNIGYKFSQEIEKSDLTFFLDADQIVLPKWLDSYLEIMKKFDIVGVEAWQIRYPDFYPIKKITDPTETFSYVGGGGMMIKSDVFEKLGKFDEDYNFMYFEDPSLCLLANQNGYKIGWNYNHVIIHNHEGPLLNKKNKQYFIKNWKKFQKKWNNSNIPEFKME